MSATQRGCVCNMVKVQGRASQNQTFLDAFGTRFAKGPQTPPTPPTPPNP